MFGFAVAAIGQKKTNHVLNSRTICGTSNSSLAALACHLARVLHDGEMASTG